MKKMKTDIAKKPYCKDDFVSLLTEFDRVHVKDAF